MFISCIKANVAKWNTTIQRGFYNTGKSIYESNYQAIHNEYDIAVDFYGTTSLRQTNLTLLRVSHINDQMASV